MGHKDIPVPHAKTLARNRTAILKDPEMHLDGAKFRIKLACDGRRYSEIVYDREKDTVTFDRTYSGLRKDTLCTRRMKVSNRAGEIKLRILIDRYSVEIFVNDGEQVMTSLIYTPLDASGIYFESNGKTILDVKKYDIEVL